MDNANEKVRNLVAFWFLGLTNNFGYVVMLSAAHDILSKSYDDSRFEGELPVSSNDETGRHCNTLGTGAILLADILPALAIKLIAPFISFHVHLRIGIVVALCIGSFMLVGIGSTYSMAIMGVVCASLSSGLGEATLLAYSTRFHRNVISTWSSGTGGAGIFGALAYASLTSFGMSPKHSILSMLVVPALMAFTFWGVLQHPTMPNSNYQDLERESESIEINKMTLIQKLRAIVPLFRYTMPLMLVYFAEYLINQGMLELIYFPGESSWISHNQQYRWYQVLYQFGVLISRSSVNIIHIKNIWALAVLQCANVFIFLFTAMHMHIGSIWIVFILIVAEGLLGGAAYVNTFYRMSTEIDPSKRDFSMQITTLSDSSGVAMAGFLAIPLHNWICKMPL